MSGSIDTLAEDRRERERTRTRQTTPLVGIVDRRPLASGALTSVRPLATWQRYLIRNASMADTLQDKVARRRTFAIISHPDAGKTTLTEKLLLFGGAIQLAGEVKAKKNRQSSRSDWMKIERERGISVVTSVMTFEYEDHVFNLLDTPGHEDFSDDTYRTLTAVDSAIMVIDAAKGIEPRTLKLFEVCRLRDIPIITFVNKMDREARDNFEILDEIEEKLALDTAPITWPIGQGKSFSGTYHLAESAVRHGDAQKERTKVNGPRADAAAGMLPENEREAFVEGVELAIEACRPFDLEAFREGHLTPVFFGSALKNYGVRDLIHALMDYAPAPRAQEAEGRHVEATEPGMSAFVFKIQANMDPNHRDRIAFVRVCSGTLSRGMKAKLVRTGKAMPLSAPQFFFASQRHLAEEAYAGDVVGIPEPRHAADRRHADRWRGHRLSRRAELCAGDPAPRLAEGCDEGQEAEGSAGPDGRGRRRPAVHAGGWLAGDRRRRRRATDRRAGRAAVAGIFAAGRLRAGPFRRGAMDLGAFGARSARVHGRPSRRDDARSRRRSGVHGAECLLAELRGGALAEDQLCDGEGLPDRYEEGGLKGAGRNAIPLRCDYLPSHSLQRACRIPILGPTPFFFDERSEA